MYPALPLPIASTLDPVREASAIKHKYHSLSVAGGELWKTSISTVNWFIEHIMDHNANPTVIWKSKKSDNPQVPRLLEFWREVYKEALFYLSRRKSWYKLSYHGLKICLPDRLNQYGEYNWDYIFSLIILSFLLENCNCTCVIIESSFNLSENVSNHRFVLHQN